MKKNFAGVCLEPLVHARLLASSLLGLRRSDRQLTLVESHLLVQRDLW